MTKTEQKKFMDAALMVLSTNGMPISWLLKKTKTSRSHWYFLKTAKRPLTSDKRDKIETALNSIPIIEI